MSLPRRDYNYEWMLRDWYGRDRAQSEIAAKQARPKPISDALDNALKTILPPSKLAITRIRGRWIDIAGKVNAKHCIPSFIREGILHIEISHPAFRMAIDTPKMRELFLSRIHNEFGNEICSGLKFIPAGRRKTEEN